VAESDLTCVVLENRHTGERLDIRRVKNGDEVWLELKGSLPPHQQGPPMHIHIAEDEEGWIRSGTLSAVMNGRRMTAKPGDSISIPRGAPHRWWNDGDELLVFEGRARPLIDLDRYLQAIFDVMNAGPAGQPSIFYIAHVALRHRRTQAVLILPRPIQMLLFRLVVATGTVLGYYSGNDWPGCPSRCTGAPMVTGEAT